MVTAGGLAAQPGFAGSLFVLPYDPLAGNEAGIEGFAKLFSVVRSLAEQVGAAVNFLASPSALLGLFISVATYHIWTRIAVWPTTTDFYTTIRVIIYTTAAFART